jgi:hypothetical protein
LFDERIAMLCLIAYSFVFGLTASGQRKIDTKWHCPNVSADHELQVGDVPGHSYAILQGTCSAVSNSGLTEKTAAYTEFVESWQESNKFFGRWDVTLQDGDQVFYSYEGNESTPSKKPVTDHWKILSGTGKYKNIRGTGNCTGLVHDDGSSDWECIGEYSPVNRDSKR